MTVKTLQKELSANEAEVILINKHDYHFQRTWLHQVAGGTLHPNRVRFEIDPLLDHDKVTFIKDTVKSIEPDEKKVVLENQIINYDYLVLGLGGSLETKGIKGIKEYAFSISSINTARSIRNHIEEQFSTYHPFNEQKEGQLTFVVAGGGLTGIEFIGELTDWIPKLCRQYHVDKGLVKIQCVSSSVLPTFDRDIAEYAIASLQKKGVQFISGKRVKECLKDGVYIAKNGEDLEFIKSNTVVWAGGVRGNTLIENVGVESENGRVKVTNDLRAPGYNNLFIIGDCSIVFDNKTGEAHSPTAQIALQQGITCAKNLLSLIRQESRIESFTPHIRGIVCSLGKDNAVGVVYGKKLFGSKALAMKKLIDNRALYMIGGSSLILKKGRFNLI
jgi:NADH dehydrogenase